MPREPSRAKQETPPTHYAPSVPDPGSAQPFVFTQLMELSAAFARVEEKVDLLKDTVKDLDASVDGLQHKVSTAKGVLIVGSIVFAIALAIVGWMVAGDVRISVGDSARGSPPAAADSAPS